MDSGIIFNIQKYSVHDGPGIRTIIFLKGCPLRCAWCSNPESQHCIPEVGHSPTKCLLCGRCAAACSFEAISLSAQGITLDRLLCQHCTGFGCVKACPAGAMVLYGDTMGVQEALDMVERDAVFYARSGGGMTLSGGEPFMQGDFALALLREAKKRYIHRAVETCGMAEEGVFLEGCALCNYLLFDIKHLDIAAHKQGTHVSNESILNLLQKARSQNPTLPIHIRTPLIPHFNDTEQAVKNMASFARELGAHAYEVLPYHRMGSQKYTYLGREYALGEAVLDAEHAQHLVHVAAQAFGKQEQ